MHVTNSYYWNNRDASNNLIKSSITEDTSDGSTVSSPLALLENRDYWQQGPTFDGSATQGCGYPTHPSTCNTGVGCGTLANRPATCTTGVAYWATNQSCSDMTGMVGADPSTSISGTFYKCTGTNSWTAYYTPYTYPHPLRGEAPDPDITAPAVPTGLMVR